MLHTLRIRQFVIIEDLTIEFGPGLNLLTGETGAGKSILVDALGLISGDRADRAMVRSGEEQAVIEALFDLDGNDAAREWAVQHGLQQVSDDGECLIRREVRTNGAGRIWVNGSPCTLSLLRDLTARLLELHGQHQQQSLISPASHLTLLDRFAGNGLLRNEVAEAYTAVRQAREALTTLRENLEAREERVVQLREAIEEIDQAALRPGELAELERDRLRLQHAGRIGELVEELVRLCYDGEPCASTLTASAARHAGELAGIDAEIGELAERLQSAAVELQDAGSFFRDYRDRMDLDPQRLEQIQARQVELERLLLKHGADEQAVLDRRELLAGELVELDRGEDAVADGEQELRRIEADYARCAFALGERRREAAPRLSEAVQRQLEALALPKARLALRLTDSAQETVEGEEGSLSLSPRGAERAELELAANPGEPLRPIGRAASGGELSRVMLALNVVVDGSGGSGSVVFDEVDAGVGGATADAVGSRLARLARGRQVLCVTHVPQVAAYADRHYQVSKKVVGKRTRTSIVTLDVTHRVDELARMLGGKSPTAASKRHASEMLAAAGRLPAERRRA